MRWSRRNLTAGHPTGDWPLPRSDTPLITQSQDVAGDVGGCGSAFTTSPQTTDPSFASRNQVVEGLRRGGSSAENTCPFCLVPLKIARDTPRLLGVRNLPPRNNLHPTLVSGGIRWLWILVGGLAGCATLWNRWRAGAVMYSKSGHGSETTRLDIA